MTYAQIITETEKVPALNFHGDDVPQRRAVYARFLPFAEGTTREAYERTDPSKWSAEKRAAAEQDYWLQIVDRGFLLDWEEYLTDVHELFGVDGAQQSANPSDGHAEVLPAVAAVQLLDLAHVPLGDTGYYALAQALPELSRVVALQLKHTRHAARWSAVHSHDFGLRALVQSLLTPLPATVNSGLGLGLGLGGGGASHFLPLTALDLEGCELGHSAGTVLADLVAGSRTLRFLQLRNNRIGESLIRVVDDTPVVVEKCPGLAALCAAAASSASLLALDLSGNRIDDDGARCLATLVAAAACPLAHLAFGDNPIGIEGGITLAGALGANRSLRSVSMRGGVQAAFAAEVAVELLRHLGRHPLLRQIDVSRNALGDSGAAALAALIGCAGTRLTHVNAAGCAIATDGMRALAAGVRRAAEYAAQVGRKSMGRIMNANDSIHC